MSKKNKLAARREAHERLLERERQQKAKKEAKRLKFQARAPKTIYPEGPRPRQSRNPEQYEEARRIVKLRKKAARTAPKKMDLEKSGTEKRRAAATEGRKSARQRSSTSGGRWKIWSIVARYPTDKAERKAKRSRRVGRGWSDMTSKDARRRWMAWRRPVD